LSTLAKVFVVINLICAVLLAASSATLFSLKKHWVEEYTKLDQRKSLEISSLTEEKNTIKVDLELKNTALAESKKDNEEMNTKYGSLKVQWDAQQKNIEGKGAELADKETRLKQLDESIAVLNKQIEETRSSLSIAQGDNKKIHDELTTLTDKLFIAEKDRNLAVGQVTKLAEENLLLKESNDVLIKGGAGSLAGAEKGQPSPPVHAVVLKVPPPPQEFIVLSAGSDDGIRVGHQFTLFREGPDGKPQYLGVAIVTNDIKAEFCVAKLVPDMRARDDKGQPMTINEKDNASTEIPAVQAPK
jgi:hypothetical protein